MTEQETTVQDLVWPEQHDEDVPVQNAPDEFFEAMFSEMHGYPSPE